MIYVLHLLVPHIKVSTPSEKLWFFCTFGSHSLIIDINILFSEIKNFAEEIPSISLHWNSEILALFLKF